MISLKPFDRTTFDSFFENVIELYAMESISAGRWDTEEALRESRKANEELLPNKENTEGHYLYQVVANEKPVGYIWAGSIDPKKKEAFIFALEIYEEERGKGYGKEAMNLIAEKMKGIGFSSIRLHVFEHSKIAISLYEKLGYATVSRLMRKEL